jgi:hypothetical protein
VSLQSKHRTPPCPRSEFSQEPTVSRSSRNPSSASTLEVFFLSCYRLYHPVIASKPFAPQQSQLQLADQQLLPIGTVAIRLFSSSESTKITKPPSLSNKYSKSSAPQQSPLQQPERQLLSIETAAIGLFFGSASTKTPPLPTHSSPPNFGVNRVHQLSRI